MLQKKATPHLETQYGSTFHQVFYLLTFSVETLTSEQQITMENRITPPPGWEADLFPKRFGDKGEPMRL